MALKSVLDPPLDEEAVGLGWWRSSVGFADLGRVG
jgi:hypothetical protein